MVEHSILLEEDRMLRTSSVSCLLGLALAAGLATVSCGDDDDNGDSTAGTSGKGGTTTGGKSSTGGTSGKAGSNTTAGTSNPTAGAAGEGDAGGAPGVVGSAMVVQTDLVSSEPAGGAGGVGAVGAANADPNLINGWGISFNPDPAVSTMFWVSAADSGVSTVYAADGTPAPLVVTIPAATAAETGHPTGQVFNTSTGFKGDKFIFATEDGLIAGWKTGTVAVVQADHSADGASYKGLALIEGADPLLVAANFDAGTIDVFDKTYADVVTPMFVDPKPVAGYAPFNVAALGDKVYVAYVKQTADKADEVAGAGLGYVNSFNPDGSFDAQLIARGGVLNAPWGLTLAPAGFTPAPGALIVGNFGDGMIHSFDPSTGGLLTEFADADGNPLVIDGLWGLTFGTKKTSADLSEQLFFAAGPAEETGGLFGVLSAP
jgi:uncharacterized protein (TIGR03118 family)